VLARDVAIKVLGEPDVELLRRFSREAEAVSRLNHPNVVSILDFNVGPVPFIVMDFLRGEDLAARIKRGPLAVGEAVDIILGVCAGMHACHSVGIIHRDLKPGNVFLQETPNGLVVKVLDFGVAILGESVSGDITQPGHVVGTPRYFSPEQIRRIEADAKSDQYAIALLTYVTLTRKSPFGRKDGSELVQAILKAIYPRPRELRPEIPEALEDTILTGMSPEKERRFPSVLDFGRAIWEFGTVEGRDLWMDPFGTPGDSPPPPPPPPARNVVQAPHANMTTQHTVSTAKGWGDAAGASAISTGDPYASERRPRPNMAVVPISPFEEEPVVATTQRLQTATAIDTSFGVPKANDNAGRYAPAVMQLRALDSEPNPKPVVRRNRVAPSDTNASSDGVTAVPEPFWRRKFFLVGAAVCLMVLTSFLTWLLTRSGGR
jgi:serine/threonine protein kinase